MNNEQTDYMADLQVAFDRYADAVWDAAEEASVKPKYDSTGHVQFRDVGPEMEARLSAAEQAFLNVAMQAINGPANREMPVNAANAATSALADAWDLVEQQAYLGGKNSDPQDPFNNIPRLVDSTETFRRATASAGKRAKNVDQERASGQSSDSAWALAVVAAYAAEHNLPAFGDGYEERLAALKRHSSVQNVTRFYCLRNRRELRKALTLVRAYGFEQQYQYNDD